MSEDTETSLVKVLLAERAELRRARASAALDARFEQSLETWSAERARTVTRRPLSWALAAMAAGVLLGSTIWLVMNAGRPPEQAEVVGPGQTPLADPDAAVLRVRASLGAQPPVGYDNGFSLSRPHYWVDVAVAPDGALYVERVTPIDDDPQLSVP